MKFLQCRCLCLYHGGSLQKFSNQTKYLNLKGALSTQISQSPYTGQFEVNKRHASLSAKSSLFSHGSFGSLQKLSSKQLLSPAPRLVLVQSRSNATVAAKNAFPSPLHAKRIRKKLFKTTEEKVNTILYCY